MLWVACLVPTLTAGVGCRFPAPFAHRRGDVSIMERTERQRGGDEAIPHPQPKKPPLPGLRADGLTIETKRAV